MVRIIPNRLKSHNGKPGSQSGSRSSSPLRTPPSDQKGLVLRTTVIKGRNLAAKDKSGTSDPVCCFPLDPSAFVGRPNRIDLLRDIVPGCQPGRVRTVDTDHHQDAESRMERLL